MRQYLDNLFRPRSVAVLGVSATKERGGHAILRGLRDAGYQGEIFAVGRGGGEFDGMAIHRTITDLPATPDLVFSAVSLQATPEAMLEAARAGVPAGIVYTAGFAEMSEEGAAIQRQMVADCNALGMRIVGPNCMGVFNTDWKLNLTSLRNVPEGPIALVSQSGNIALTLINDVAGHDMGFSAFVSFGNQADIPVHDYIEYLAAQESVRIIVLYLESLQDGMGEEFVRTCRRVSKRIPIVAIKGGVTHAGRRAAASHTARLSGAREIYSAAFQQAGIVQVDSLDHVLAVTEAILRCPSLENDSIAIVGSGGGHSTIAADEVERAGLEVTPFSEDTVEEVARHLPPWAPMRNPVDMTGGFTEDLTLFPRLMSIPLALETFGGGLSYGLYGEYGGDVVDRNGLTYTTAAPLLGELQAKLDKPIVFYTPYARSRLAAFSAMRNAGVPCFASIPEAAAALRGLRARCQAEQLPALDDAPADHVGSPTVTSPAAPTTLSESASLELLARSGIRTVRQVVVPTAEAAVQAAAAIGYPVVLKAQLTDVGHKSDLGGVRLGLRSADEVAAAAQDMAHRIPAQLGIRALDGFSVSEQIPSGRELILGAHRDNVFGHSVIVGIGGVMTEVIERVAVLVAPFTQADLEAALERAGIADFLGEWRGTPRVDLLEVVSALRMLLGLSAKNRCIDAIDVNPLVMHGTNLVAVDASISLRP